jgi:hypothetical protein
MSSPMLPYPRAGSKLAMSSPMLPYPRAGSKLA